MEFDADAVLADIRRLSLAINVTPDGPERDALEQERDELRARARLAADATRPEALLRAELDHVVQQLARLGEVGIKPALNESYKLVTDPSAYRNKINEAIATNEADRKAELERRRSELLAALQALQAD